MELVYSRAEANVHLAPQEVSALNHGTGAASPKVNELFNTNHTSASPGMFISHSPIVKNVVKPVIISS